MSGIAAPLHLVTLGPKTSPRLTALANAADKAGSIRLDCVDYASFAEAPEKLAAKLRPGSWLRVESPDRDVQAWEALYGLGYEAAMQAGFLALDAKQATITLNTRGAIGSPAQLAFGIGKAVEQAEAIARTVGAGITVGAADTALAYDKTACINQLQQQGISTPPFLGTPTCFEEMLELMRMAAVSRAFVKLRFGSAAAGMIALAIRGAQVKAYSTAVLGAGNEVFFTRKLQTLTDASQLRRLIDTLAPKGLHLESWLPKASVTGGVCDLRFVVIGGETMLPVLRVSHLPMTNLHLGGKRHPITALQENMSVEDWQALLHSVKSVAQRFASVMAIGIDAMVTSGFGNHAILEANAFGDFVKDVTLEGKTPQDLLIEHLRKLSVVAA